MKIPPVKQNALDAVDLLTFAADLFGGDAESDAGDHHDDEAQNRQDDPLIPPYGWNGGYFLLHQALGEIADEKIEPLEQKTEGDQGKSRAHPGQIGPLVGGEIGVAVDHAWMESIVGRRFR
jgi:hypothetical protein